MNENSITPLVKKVVSGGQTGVDRAALDVAIALGIAHGGWCPRGRIAEDGRIPRKYRLRETATAEYPQRTEQNVIDSDGTLILYRGELTGGTELTRRMTSKHAQPCLAVDLRDMPDVMAVQTWLLRESIAVLNVAGPRESSEPGIADEAFQFLYDLLSHGEDAS